jgi:NADH-quinone oxidoreductase subunit C
MVNNYLTFIFKKLFLKNFNTLVLDYSPRLIARQQQLSSFASLLTIFKLSTATRLNTLVEFTTYDIPACRERFTCNLFFLSVEYNFRLGININIFQMDFFPSLAGVYPNSNWSEREMRDMFGIYFVNNPDLRRLLTDYGFEGFPLRKDFPLTGYFEVRYDDEFQQILYEPVQLAQEFRLFTLPNPWEKKL